MVYLPDNTWDPRFLALAACVASWSKDRSTQVGAVLVDSDRGVRSVGYNGLPRGCQDDTESRHQRPEKYLWAEHAERNAIYNAARVGIPTAGCVLYVTHPPCADCARAIAQSGVLRVVHPPPPSGLAERFADSFRVAAQVFAEGGVTVTVCGSDAPSP